MYIYEYFTAVKYMLTAVNYHLRINRKKYNYLSRTSNNHTYNFRDHKGNTEVHYYKHVCTSMV